MNLLNLFSERIAKAQVEIVALKKRDAAFSTFRLVLVLFALGCTYLALKEASWLFFGVSFLLFLAFIALIIRHRQLRENLVYVKHWLKVNEDEFAFLKNDFERFDIGKEFSEPEHEFADDLDLFSRKGLFQRVNRTVTRQGAQLLANRFKENEMQSIQAKQEAVKELSEKLDFRHAFLAEGEALTEEKFLKEQIKQWIELPTASQRFLNPSILWLLTLWYPALFALILAFGDISSSKWLGIGFLVNLIIFGRLLKYIKAERNFVDSLAKSFNVRSKLIALIENEAFEANILKEQKQQLSKYGKTASVALKELGGLLSRLDSMDNAVGAMLFNGTIFYHVHALSNLIKWKKKYALQLNAWLQIISEFDYWISLSGYAHKQPDFSYPIISETSGFEAQEIGHPFLEAEHRITNDLKFNGFELVILTGSNMAGKSTFLRTVGVNLVLTKLGLPVCAKSFKTDQFQLLTSMKPQDSLAGNESYFQAEVNRLRMLVDLMQSGKRSFVLLDEILRGTNSQDKRNGTVAFLNKIKHFNLIGIVATHDVEITDLTFNEKETFCNMFFESQLKNDELVFDYKLRNGVCTTPNASDLMRIKGII